MLARKSSSATSTKSSATMPPPPVPTSTPLMVMDDFSALQELVPAAYVSPEMAPADSAVLGYAAHGSAPGSVTTEFDSLFNSLWGQTSPSTSFIPNIPLPPTPVSASLSADASFTSPLFNSSPYPQTPAVDAFAAWGLSPDIADTSPAQLNLLDDFESNFPLFNDIMTTSTQNKSQSTSQSVPPMSASSSAVVAGFGLQLKTSLSRHGSWEQQPRSAESTTSSVSPQSLSTRPLTTSPPATSPPSNARPPNGVRKNVKVADLIPIDAPIQPRNYITPSATSRKDVPPSVARTFVPNSRKRSATAAGLASSEDMQDELEDELSPEEVARRQQMREMDPEKAALLEHVETARRRNTLAARKSRQRKLEHVRGLEEIVERLQAENEELKSSKEDVMRENEELKERVRALEARLGGGM